MLKLKNCWILAAIAAVALWPGAGQAGGSNLDLEELAALLVLPVITGGQPANLQSNQGDVIVDTQRASTLVTVTNANEENRLLLIDVISGDIGEDAWKSNSYRCYITGRETTTLVFGPAGPGTSSLHAECGELVVSSGRIEDVLTQGRELRRTTLTQNGFVVISVAMADGTAPGSDTVVGSNDLFGDAIVVDPDGQAYSVAALSFQADGDNDGDKAYEFGKEYAALPSVLVSHFVAEGPTNGVNAELILLTLDGKVGGAVTPQVAIAGNTFDDDENSDDWQYSFDCFDIVPLSQLAPSFVFDPGGFNLRSPTGHFDLASYGTGSANDVHDLNFGDGNNFRNRGVHGWLVQNVDGVLLNPNQPITEAVQIGTLNQAAWARPLLQSTTSLTPVGQVDVPTLDASGAP